MSTSLPVRRLQIDLETSFGRRWNGGDAFRTALFNALSMSFPAGEQLFIDSVRRGLAALPEDGRARFADEIQGFIGQEATHRHLHGRFNAQLAAQGLVNHWEARILRRRVRLEPLDVRIWVGITAATEHWTAVLAQRLLAQPALLHGAEPRLAQLWQWHAAEELEHRATAFDLYVALGGDREWRLRLFRLVSAYFVIDVLRQTLDNLWHDGSWWRVSTWTSAWRTLFGADGLVRQGYRPWKQYLAADFHPLQGEGEAGTRWLAEHAALAPPVRG